MDHKPSASYWGNVAGSNLAGGAAYLAVARKIPKAASKIGGVKRFGAMLAAEQAASAIGGAIGHSAGKEIDTKTGHKVVDTKNMSDIEQTEHSGGETAGFLAGGALGARHGIVSGAIGGAAGAVGGSYIAGRIAHALKGYHPEVASKIHRSALS